MDNTDKAIAILTHKDAHKLASYHESLIQWVAKGYATEDGIKAFNDLYDEVIAGNYKVPRKTPAGFANWQLRL